MKCSVIECDRQARYKSPQLCQMHYFRLRRTGTTQPRRPKPRQETPNGYVRVYAPDHPLADPSGYVFEHRKVAYDDRGGELSLCEACGLVDITWETCHVDHQDEDRQNNVPSNLLATCIGCNVMRGQKRPRHTHAGRIALTYDGITQTATEWARDPRVRVSSSTIRQRKWRGATDEQALFASKVTHTSRAPKKVRTKFENGKRVRT